MMSSDSYKMDSDDCIRKISTILRDTTRPMKERFRALFTLRNLGGKLAVACISDCFTDPSALLKHELAYCLGQMQDTRACAILEAVLTDPTQPPMVRHEAGEALGAICCIDSLAVLEQFVNDPAIEVAETCRLAMDKIQWSNNPNASMDNNPYKSVDPAPSCDELNVDKLKHVLLDEDIALFDRYRAMFALRNIGDTNSVLALAEGLGCKSALFRHEIAFVLGQIQHEAAIPQLIKNLSDMSENEMVRHECAEALGSIASTSCNSVLEIYLKDENQVVRESCEVALDMVDYQNSGEFQYANAIIKVREEMNSS